MEAVKYRMGVEPGSGVVARFGNVAVVAGIGGAADAFTQSLLDVLAVGSANAEMLWRVAELLTKQRSAAPPFGLFSVLGNERRLLLYGATRAVVDMDELSGGEALTWLDRPVSSDARTVAVTMTTTGPITPDPRTDLQRGTVGGVGFVLEAVGLTSPLDSASAAPRSGSNRPTTLRRERVPTAIRARETTRLVAAIAHLVADDGSRVPIDRSYVLGRDPRQDPAVRHGAASPVLVPDAEGAVSRVHAYVDVENGVLTIRDAGSRTGTDVAAPGDEDWTRLGTASFALPEGWSFRIGRRVYTHVGPGTEALS